MFVFKRQVLYHAIVREVRDAVQEIVLPENRIARDAEWEMRDDVEIS